MSTQLDKLEAAIAPGVNMKVRKASKQAKKLTKLLEDYDSLLYQIELRAKTYKPYANAAEGLDLTPQQLRNLMNMGRYHAYSNLLSWWKDLDSGKLEQELDQSRSFG